MAGARVLLQALRACSRATEPAPAGFLCRQDGEKSEPELFLRNGANKNGISETTRFEWDDDQCPASFSGLGHADILCLLARLCPGHDIARRKETRRNNSEGVDDPGPVARGTNRVLGSLGADATATGAQSAESLGAWMKQVEALLNRLGW